jgi:sec-independent protein translocase protein TatC
MTVVEHLEELRYRLIVMVVAVAVGMIPGWLLYGPVLHLLQSPFCDWVHSLPRLERPPAGCDLVVQGVVEPILLKMKIVMFIGLAIALPIVLYQLWEFVTPGLTDKERRIAVPFIASSVFFFALGAVFSYFTLKGGLNFLLGFGGTTLTPLLTAPRYLTFVGFMVLAFGLSFEFPLVLIFLAYVRVLPSQKLRAWRRWAIVAIVFYAAIVTPSQDPITQLAMAVPMYLFYEGSILVARLMKR